MADPVQSVSALLRTGMAHHQAGRLGEAETLYRRVLAVQPRQPDALNLMGLVHHQRGAAAKALARFDEAIAVAPRVPEYHNNRGMALTRLGRPDEAVAALREALAQRKAYPEASFNLGNALRLQGDVPGACAAYRAALAQRSTFAEAHSNLGNLLTESGDAEAGARHLERVLALRPATPEALNNLAAALLRLVRLEEAEARLQEALALRADFAPAHLNLARVVQGLGRPEEALASLNEAVRLRPDDVEARLQLGRLLVAAQQHQAAIPHLQAAATSRPQDAGIRYELGHALQETAAYRAAMGEFRRALELEPGRSDARVHLGNVLMSVGRVPEAIEQFEQAAGDERHGRIAAGNRLLALNYRDGLPAEAVWQAHRDYGRALEESIAPLPAPAGRDRDPQRRLRVGYVSADFRWHSCAFFSEPLLAAHDPAAVEVLCYSTTDRPDAITGRLRRLVPAWRDAAGMSDAALAEQIRADGIDILVDLAGHTGSSRLAVFAMKPAPVQVTWLGYPNTTGLSRIDYRLTDAQVDPPGPADARHAEQLVRLPRLFLCYRPPAAAGEVAQLPALQAGAVTFGSFNAAPKLAPSTIALWGEILRALPEARLLMKNQAMADEEVRVRFRKLFAEQGIAPERVGLFPFTRDLGGGFAVYGSVDLCLDSFPYTGTTTTCDALWMGVPVVTLEGDRHAGRVSSSILRAVGLDECIAATREGYRDTALALAADLPRLAALRGGLRARVAASPLRHEAGFARAVEQAYREMWRRWCASPA